MGFSDTPQTHYDAQWVTQLANQIAELIETDIRVSSNELSIFWEYAGEGYGIPTKDGVNMIKLMAQTEGILLEPVYTAKTMAGLVDLIQKGTLTEDDTVLFLHTGGIPGLFQDAKQVRQILGSLK